VGCEDDQAVADEAFHLDLMPVAGVGENDLGGLLDPCRAELGFGGADHRFEVAEVGRVDGDVGGDHDLVFGGDGLGVVALHPPARRLDVARIESLRWTFPPGVGGGLNGFGGRPNFLPFLSTPRAR
jgi:hypothetical protein